MQQEINIKVGSKPPGDYMKAVLESIEAGAMKYGAISSKEDLAINLKENAIPESILSGRVDNFEDFLQERRVMMANIIETYYKRL
jgi:hypothetical protein